MELTFDDEFIKQFTPFAKSQGLTPETCLTVLGVYAMNRGELFPLTARRQQNKTEAISYDLGLYNALTRWRLTVAQDNHMPAFMVFNNQVLKNIAAAKPLSKESLLAVSGVGPAKFDAYGQDVINIVSTYYSSQNRKDDLNE